MMLIRRRCLPEVLVRREEITTIVEAAETHAIRVCLEHLVPAPKHVTVHVEVYPAGAAKLQEFVLENGLKSRVDSRSVNSLGV